MLFMWIAISGLFIVAVAVSVYAVWLNKRLSLTEEKLSQQIKSLHHDLVVNNNAAIGVGQRLINTEKKLKGTIEKQQQLETCSIDFLPFNQAASMVENGADAKQLVDRCGLSEAEAGLMALLQREKNNVAKTG
ncbi:MAG: DUF2802 domain-containing protein [Pseudomonadales bacterium]